MMLRGRRRLILWAICSVIVTMLSSVYLIFNIENIYYLSLLGVICLSVIVCVISVQRVLIDIRLVKNEEKEKEENVKSVYRYNQLLNPPDSDMNN